MHQKNIVRKNSRYKRDEGKICVLKSVKLGTFARSLNQ